MKGYYFNLIEDEKEARDERRGMYLAFGLIIISAIFLWNTWKKKKE